MKCSQCFPFHSIAPPGQSSRIPASPRSFVTRHTAIAKLPNIPRRSSAETNSMKRIRMPTFNAKNCFNMFQVGIVDRFFMLLSFHLDIPLIPNSTPGKPSQQLARFANLFNQLFIKAWTWWLVFFHTCDRFADS